MIDLEDDDMRLMVIVRVYENDKGSGVTFYSYKDGKDELGFAIPLPGKKVDLEHTVNTIAGYAKKAKVKQLGKVVYATFKKEVTH